MRTKRLVLYQITRVRKKKYGNVTPKTVAKSFVELFKLVEDYAPSWYTQERRNRALAAMGVLSRGKIQKDPRKPKMAA